MARTGALLTAAAVLLSCARSPESSTTPEPAPVAVMAADPTRAAVVAADSRLFVEALPALSDEALQACEDAVSGVNRRAMAGDLSAGGMLIGREHAHEDMTRLCASPDEVPGCFDDAFSASLVVDCLRRHYCAVLRDHGTATGLLAMPGADDPSKVVILRHMMRDASITRCALLGELERRAAP